MSVEFAEFKFSKQMPRIFLNIINDVILARMHRASICEIIYSA